MKNQLVQLEKNVDTYLTIGNSQKMVAETNNWVKYRPPFLNALFYKKEGGEYRLFFKYPQTFDEEKIRINHFSGYFMVNKNLYHGVMKEKGNFVVLIALTLNQKFFDELSTINDFKLVFTNPKEKPFPKVFQDYLASTDIKNQSTIELPWKFEYKFMDFNTLDKGKPLEKSSGFLFIINFDKIFHKIDLKNLDYVQDFSRTLIYILIIIFGIFIVISFIIGFRMVRVITHSINQITKGIQKIRRGDFSVRIRIKSGDQMHYLAESFNEMAAGINRLLDEEKEKHRLEEQLKIARSIQLKLLQKESFSCQEFEIEAINIPATEIAGDYFDYYYQANDYLSVLVADVSGKGASAAFYAAELKGLINYLQKKGNSPNTLISECHTSLHPSFEKSTFITLSIAKFIIPEKKFVFCRAGHTQGLFYQAKSKECHELNPEGMAIGLINFSKEKIEEVDIHYQKDDILFLFSDGLSEIMNDQDEILGIDNLKTLLKKNHHLPTKELKQKIIDFSINFSGKKNNSDDLTFIIVRIK